LAGISALASGPSRWLDSSLLRITCRSIKSPPLLFSSQEAKVTFESIIQSRQMREAVRSGTLGTYIDGFVDGAAAIGYTQWSFRDLVLGASQFARFLTIRGLTNLAQIREPHVKSFISTLPVFPAQNRVLDAGGPWKPRAPQYAAVPPGKQQSRLRTTPMRGSSMSGGLFSTGIADSGEQCGPLSLQHRGVSRGLARRRDAGSLCCYGDKVIGTLFACFDLCFFPPGRTDPWLKRDIVESGCSATRN